MSTNHAILHVVQASYGDSLLLEYKKDKSNPKEFMLIDGGPPGQRKQQASLSNERVTANLFKTLNLLSTKDILNVINTVVVTHDDEDHKTGIQKLFASLLRDKTAKPKANERSVWLNGDKLLSSGTAPIKHVWYNSLRNLAVAQELKDATTSKDFDGWFDQQLRAYAAKVTKPGEFNDEFNDEFASVSLPGKTATTKLAMHGSAPVKRGQFDLIFLGPVTDTLVAWKITDDGGLTNPDSMKNPTYTYDSTTKRKAVSNMSNDAAKGMLERGEETADADPSSLDTSKRNASSISFCAQDAPINGYRILLLGDSNASTFSDIYRAEGYNPVDYSIMKIMHHGSNHNNFWKRIEGGAAVPGSDLTVFRDYGVTNELQKDAAFFFAKIRAKRYVISASSIERHPNPHVSTIMGILLGALENKKTVDIYLTNPLSPSVRKRVGEFAKTYQDKMPDKELPIRLHLLKEDQYYGSIDLYEFAGEGTHWGESSLSGNELWSTYQDMIRGKFPDLVKVMEEVEIAVIPPTKARVPGEPTRLVVRPHVPVTLPSLAQSVAAPIVVPKRTSNQLTTQYTTLGFAGAMSHEEITAAEQYPTKDISDFPALLEHLVQERCITDTQKAQIELEARSGQGEKYTLAAVISLFFGIDAASKFLSSMPCDLTDSTDFLSIPTAPTYWIVTNFTAKVVDTAKLKTKASKFKGWRGLHSFSFDLASPASKPIEWTFPFSNASPDQKAAQYTFKHDGPINISVQWPTYDQRFVSGSFQGLLSQTYHVVGHLTMLTGHPTQYRFFFADSDYSVEKHTTTFKDLLNLFNAQFTSSNSLKDFAIKGLEDVLSKVTDTVPLRNGGFLLQRLVSGVVLQRIFADLDFNKLSAWKPFGSTGFSFDVSELHTVIDDAYSPNRNLKLQLDGGMTFNETRLPFLLTAQFTLQKFMLFEVAILPGLDDNLSITQLLAMVGVPSSFDLSQVFPGLSNISNSISISYAALGWTGSVLPDYGTLAISIDDWTLIKDVLTIENITVEVKVSDLSSNAPKELELAAWGVVLIEETEVEAYFNITHDPASTTPDLVNFQISTQDNAIPLGKIISHFFGNTLSLFPACFQSLLEETGLESFVIQAARDKEGWSVTELQILVTVDGQFDLFEDIDICYPTLEIFLQYPFDASKRTVYAGLSATVRIGEIATTTTIMMSSDAQTEIALKFTSLEEPVTLQVLLAHFVPSLNDIAVPPVLAFFFGLGIDEAALSMNYSQGKFSLKEISLGIISTSSLQIWEELALTRISLLFFYSKDGTKMVQFDAMLTIGTGPAYLHFSFSYDGTSSSLSGPPPNPGAVVSIPPGSSWNAVATYDGKISTYDTLKSVSGIDLRKEFDSLSLSMLNNVLDITLSDLAVTLTRVTSATPRTAFTFTAKTDWLKIFSNIRFACTRTDKWSYSLGFGIQSSSQLSTSFPALKPIFDFVSFNNVGVVVFNNILDPGALPAGLNIPATINHDGTSVAFAGNVSLNTTKLALLHTLLSYLSLDILGVVGDEFISLSLLLPKDKEVSLFDGQMKLSGSFIIQCSKVSNMAPIVGLEGDATLDFGSHVSKGPIRVSLRLLVDTSTAGLGFDFRLDKWESVFGFDGLSFHDVRFAATFPPETFPVPSYFAIAGKIDLTVNAAHFGGQVDLQVVPEAITRCYATGSIEGLDLENILQAFTDIRDFPDYLNAGFGPLKFTLVPQDLTNAKGEYMKQEFMMSGSMQIAVVHFKADVYIDIKKTQVTIKGNLSRIVIIDENLFSIVASPAQSPPPKDGAGATLDMSIGISAFHILISGKFTFFGISRAIYFTLSKKGLEFDMTFGLQNVVSGSVSGHVNKDGLSLSSNVSITLHLNLPAFKIGSVQFGSIYIASFSAGLNVSVVWSNIVWSVGVKGSFDVFGLDFSKSLTVHGDVKDFKDLALAIGKAIIETFATEFLDALKAIVSDLGRVLNILKQIGLSIKDALTFLVESLGVAWNIALKAIKEFFEMSWNALVIVLRDIGKAAEEIVNFLKNLVSDIVDLAKALVNAFGHAVKELCGKILKEAGKVIKEITQFYQDVVNLDAAGAIEMLLQLGFGTFDIAGVIVDVFSLGWDVVWALIKGSSSGKSAEQVQGDLAVDLWLDANKRLVHPYAPISIMSVPLSQLLTDYATSTFNQSFQYSYSGKQTSPPKAILPLVGAFDSYLSFTDGKLSHIDDFASTIVRALTLPSWAASSASYDLTQELRALPDVPRADTFQTPLVFQKMYTSTDGNDCIKTNAIILFANGALTEDNQDVTEFVVSYMGVYFHFEPPTKAARAAMRDEARTQASKLMNNGNPLADDNALEKAIGTYSAGLFKSQFQFTPDSKPKELADGGLDNTANALEYIEDLSPKDISNFVQEKIFKTLNPPTWMSSTAQNDVINDFKHVESIGTPGSWTSQYIDHTYMPADDTTNPVVCKGVTIYYTDSKTTNDRITVEITYIFFLGVLYEVRPPKVIVSEDLLKTVYANLLLDLGEKPVQGYLPTLTEIQTALAKYSEKKFKTGGIDYDYDGSNTKPTDLADGGALYAIENFHAFKKDADWTAVGVDSSSWIGNILSSSILALFSPTCTLSADLLSTVKPLLSIDNSNDWSYKSFNQTYDGATSDNQASLTGVVVYVNGKQSEGVTVVKQSFFYFLGVAYAVDGSAADNGGW